MVYLQLQVRLRWCDTPPSSGMPIQDATSVDSAMLIMAAHSARIFKESVSVGDSSWHDCMAWCAIPEPAPPAYATHGFAALPTMPRKPGFSASNPQYGHRPQSQATTTTMTRASEVPIPSITRHTQGKSNDAPSDQDLAQCATCHSSNNHTSHHGEDGEDGEDGQRCRFGRPCGVLLTDLTEDGLNRHLAQYHLQDLQDSVIRAP